MNIQGEKIEVLGLITLRDVFREVVDKKFEDIDVHMPVTLRSVKIVKSLIF